MHKKLQVLIVIILVMVGIVAVAQVAEATAPAQTAVSASVTVTSVATVTTRSSWLPKACQGRSVKVICVSKSQDRLFALQGSRLVRSASARHGGRASDGSGPWFSRTGVFRTFSKSPNMYSYLYHVNMPWAQCYSNGQCVHYSSEYANGYPYSHGCIGLRDWAATKWLYYWAPAGTLVIVT